MNRASRIPATLRESAPYALIEPKGVPMKKLVVLSAVFFSGLAVAQGLPQFGTARFGEAVFGQASSGADALPVPFMPLWATITLAVALWVVAYMMRSKES